MHPLKESVSSTGPHGRQAGAVARDKHYFPVLRAAIALLLATASVFVVAATGSQAPASPHPNGSPSYQITSAVIAGGGVTRAESPCFELAGTTGQPVAGASSNSTYALIAGFWGGAVFNDTIFRNTFEACTP